MARIFKDRSFYISLGAAAVISLAVYLIADKEGLSRGNFVSDCLFTGGGLVLGAAGLRFCAHEGVFDLLGFGISKAANIHWPWLTEKVVRHPEEKYNDYKERKSAEEHVSVLPQAAAGLVFVIAAALFLLL